MTPHGSDTGYTNYACRCDLCKKAHALAMQKWKVRRARHTAAVKVDAKQTKREVSQLMRRGFNERKIGQLCGVPRSTVYNVRRPYRRQVMASTAEKIHGLWLDVFGPVEKDERRYPAAPLLNAVVAKYGSLKAVGAAECRRLHHFQQDGTISEAQADRWAMRLLDKMPHEVWDEAS